MRGSIEGEFAWYRGESGKGHKRTPTKGEFNLFNKNVKKK